MELIFSDFTYGEMFYIIRERSQGGVDLRGHRAPARHFLKLTYAMLRYWIGSLLEDFSRGALTT